MTTQPRLGDIEFLHWASVPNYRCLIDTVITDYYTVQLVDAAGAQLTLGDREYELQPGTFWSSKPGDHLRHQAACPERGFTQRYIALTGPAAEQWKAAGLLPFAPQPAPLGKDYGAEFDRLIDFLNRRTPLANMQARNLLECILLDLAEARELSQRPKWLDNVLKKMHSPRCFHLEMDDLASTGKMSVPTLRRKFRQAMDCPINDYHIRRRIESAKRLLLQSDEAIGQISEQLGYQNLPFFVRQFSKFTGVSPKEYRKNPYSAKVIK